MRRARRQRQIGRETPGRERQQWGGGGEREREAEEKGEAEGKTPITSSREVMGGQSKGGGCRAETNTERPREESRHQQPAEAQREALCKG